VSNDRADIVARLRAAGVVAVLRAESADELADITNALLSGGVTAVEVTTTTPDAVSGIAQLRELFGERALLGVGTVLDPKTAHDAIAAGAQFVVSPTCDSQIIKATHAANRVSIPGAYTPSEILAAHRAGADVVKVFPSGALGPGYFKDLLAPLPFLKLMPTGGVDSTNAGPWIKAGAVCVGAGSALVPKDAVRGGDWPAITKLAEAFVRSVSAARNENT
jgi:2-dehydro-3-deoxyphosphogluconate aldolase/(4S)-4-hydroxy-2-oxoglutarate aldolase